MKGIAVACLAILVCRAALSFGQTYGTIRATVIDEKGNPVEGATLYAQPRGGVMAAMIPYCETGPAGSCAVSHLDFGRYWVYGAKPEAGYPALDSVFFEKPGSQPAKAQLSIDHPSQVLVVHLGIKAGILKGTVADAVTGKPLDANAKFRWISDPTISLSGSGLTNAQFRVLIPSDVALTMVVSLEGYEDWVYVDTSAARKPLLLRPGEEKVLDIRLKPKPR